MYTSSFGIFSAFSVLLPALNTIRVWLAGTITLTKCVGSLNISRAGHQNGRLPSSSCSEAKRKRLCFDLMTTARRSNNHFRNYCTGYRSSGLAEARLERTVRAERVSMFDASTRGTLVGRSRAARVTNGRGPSGRFHGSHTYISGAGGEAQSSSCGCRRVQLSESHRPFHHR